VEGSAGYLTGVPGPGAGLGSGGWGDPQGAVAPDRPSGRHGRDRPPGQRHAASPKRPSRVSLRPSTCLRRPLPC